MKNIRVLLSVFFLSLFSSVQCEDIQPPSLLVDDWNHDHDRDRDDDDDDDDWHRRHRDDDDDDGDGVEIVL
jgi:hypothetical protein